jgi:hypothetical protein
MDHTKFSAPSDACVVGVEAREDGFVFPQARLSPTHSTPKPDGMQNSQRVAVSNFNLRIHPRAQLPPLHGVAL